MTSTQKKKKRVLMFEKGKQFLDYALSKIVRPSLCRMHQRWSNLDRGST